MDRVGRGAFMQALGKTCLCMRRVQERGDLGLQWKTRKDVRAQLTFYIKQPAYVERGDAEERAKGPRRDMVVVVVVRVGTLKRHSPSISVQVGLRLTARYMMRFGSLAKQDPAQTWTLSSSLPTLQHSITSSLLPCSSSCCCLS